MRNDDGALWVVLPPELHDRAIRHGNLRQAEAQRRKANVRWHGEYEELADNHVGHSIFERAVARALGLYDPFRMNTDHKLPRLDLTVLVGLWPRACPMFGPPYVKGLKKDYDLLIGGRVFEHEPCGCVAEIRGFAEMRVVRERYDLVDTGNRGAPYYHVPWASKDFHPIKELVSEFQLDTSACSADAPDSISQMIDFAPLRPHREQCTDGCPDRRPSEAGGFICNVCGYFLFK